jgi:hypothetical protein
MAFEAATGSGLSLHQTFNPDCLLITQLVGTIDTRITVHNTLEKICPLAQIKKRYFTKCSVTVHHTVQFYGLSILIHHLFILRFKNIKSPGIIIIPGRVNQYKHPRYHPV